MHREFFRWPKAVTTARCSGLNRNSAASFPLDEFHVSRSLAKLCRQQVFEVRVDTAFDLVLNLCSERTARRDSTWINDPIRTLYNQLFKMGFCHSVECWQDGELLGGLYGLSIGSAFFGESMFSRTQNASKVALVHLVARLNAGGFTLLDAQFINDHLKQFGAQEVSRAEYHEILEDAIERDASFNLFSDDDNPTRVLAQAVHRAGDFGSMSARVAD